MPQKGTIRPTAPYFVEYLRVRKHDRVVIKSSGGGMESGTARAPGVIGAVVGAGPKEWSPRSDAMRGTKTLMTVAAGSYVTITVNGDMKLSSSLCLHQAVIVLRED